jgi:hypothetical protein
VESIIEGRGTMVAKGTMVEAAFIVPQTRLLDHYYLWLG